MKEAWERGREGESISEIVWSFKLFLLAALAVVTTTATAL